MLAAGTGAQIASSVDDGANWVTRRSAVGGQTVWGRMAWNGGVIIVGRDNGYVCRSTDGGQTWADVLVQSGHSIQTTLWVPELGLFLAVRAVFTGSWYDLYLHSSPDGLTWTHLTAAGRLGGTYLSPSKIGLAYGGGNVAVMGCWTGGNPGRIWYRPFSDVNTVPWLEVSGIGGFTRDFAGNDTHFCVIDTNSNWLNSPVNPITSPGWPWGSHGIGTVAYAITVTRAGKFLICANWGDTMRWALSDQGSTWTNFTGGAALPEGYMPQSIIERNGRYHAVQHGWSTFIRGTAAASFVGAVQTALPMATNVLFG